MPIHVALHHQTTYRYDRLVNSWAAGHPPAARAALPHADHGYSLKIEPRRPLHQLAAGPAEQLPGAPGVPGTDATRFVVEVDLVAEMTVINPFDFFLEPYAEKFPFAYEPCAARRSSRRSWSRCPPGPLLQALPRTIDRASSGAPSISWST